VKLSPHEWAWLFRNVNVDGIRAMTNDEIITATAVVFAESGGETDTIAYSPTTSKFYGNADHGACQISGWWNGPNLQRYRFRDPYDSVRMFKLIWQAAGYTFAPWNVTDTGAEQQYLKRAEVGLRYPFEPVNPNVVGWRR
jgi:hypothetical protein